MIEIKKIILKLFDKALVNPRLRQNYDFHISSDDGSQRMLETSGGGAVGVWHTVEVFEPFV